MSTSLKQETLRARKGKFKQITMKHICKGEILTNLDYIHKEDNHKVKTCRASGEVDIDINDKQIRMAN